MRFNGIALAIITLLFTAIPAPADEIRWQAPTHDVSGNALNPSHKLTYRLYARSDEEGSAYKFVVEVDSPPLDLSTAEPGCYKFYLTAVISDARKRAESEPSEIVLSCLNLECGTVGSDGTTGQCNNEIPLALPEQPTGVIVIRSAM